MNALKVVCMDEELMEEADKHFDIVTHITEDGEQEDPLDVTAGYSGEFVIYDSRPQSVIQEHVKDIKKNIV